MYFYLGSLDFLIFMVMRSEDVWIVDDDDLCDVVEGVLNFFFCGFFDVSEGSVVYV